MAWRRWREAPGALAIWVRAASLAVLAHLARLAPAGASLARAVAVLGVDARLDDAARREGLAAGDAADVADALIAVEVLHRGDTVESCLTSAKLSRPTARTRR